MKNKKTFWRILAAILFALFLICAIVVVVYFIGPNDDKLPDDTTDEITTEADTDTSDTTDAQTEPVLVDNPIDFKPYQKENPHVYAWIRLEGTKIDYPIVQHPWDEEYYVRRDWKGNNDVYGCIFTQSLNTTDFSDPNTVIYGHQTNNGTFFGSLHNFRDPQYFENNKYFYIYTPGHIYTYEIFAAYEYDNRHILYSFDFTDPVERQEYFDTCINPVTMYKNIREGASLDVDDKIVTLSTCLENGDLSKRYLVQGVLIKDEQTK